MTRWVLEKSAKKIKSLIFFIMTKVQNSKVCDKSHDMVTCGCQCGRQRWSQNQFASFDTKRMTGPLQEQASSKN